MYIIDHIKNGLGNKEVITNSFHSFVYRIPVKRKFGFFYFKFGFVLEHGKISDPIFISFPGYSIIGFVLVR